MVAVDIADAQVSETAAAVVARGGQASAYVVDVSDAGEVWKLADEIRARHGGADIVVVPVEDGPALAGGRVHVQTQAEIQDLHDDVDDGEDPEADGDETDDTELRPARLGPAEQERAEHSGEE